MKRSILVGSLTTCFCLGLAPPALAAATMAAIATTPSPAGVVTPPATTTAVPLATAGVPAQQCLTDLRAFNAQMQKDGYWLGGSGYGYPMGGLGVGYRGSGTSASLNPGYQDARPGYEVRTLIAAANILARHGKQQSCEAVLATTRSSYKLYVADMHSGGVPEANVPSWQQQQIAAAQPVAGASTSYRSDELLGTDVRDPKNDDLGSVDDLVMSPTTGKIAYLVIARGGIFGIGQNYVPVPWADFKVTPTVDLFVLDTTKAAMDAAPQVSNGKFATATQFAQQSQKVDAYWKANMALAASLPSGG